MHAELKGTHLKKYVSSHFSTSLIPSTYPRNEMI